MNNILDGLKLKFIRIEGDCDNVIVRLEDYPGFSFILNSKSESSMDALLEAVEYFVRLSKEMELKNFKVAKKRALFDRLENHMNVDRPNKALEFCFD